MFLTEKALKIITCNIIKGGTNIMPKIKTSRAAAKRFKKTGTGKLKEK